MCNVGRSSDEETHFILEVELLRMVQHALHLVDRTVDLREDGQDGGVVPP